ncbi:flagellar motor switch protein FliM [Bacillaceae bacterium]
MAEVLSQSEIDALLSALSSGQMDVEALRKEEAEKKIKLYDFKRALRFSKDQIRTLTRIHENYARILTSYLSAHLRTFVQISVASVEQLPYDEFIRSIPKITILNIFEPRPLEGRMVIEMNPQIAYAMLDRLLGGQGVAPDKIRSLTEIEIMVMEGIFNLTLAAFREAWKSVLEVEPRLDVLETNPQFMQIVSANDTVVVVTLSAKVGETTGMINLCLPHVVLEPIIPKLTAHHWFSAEKKEKEKKGENMLRERIARAKLPVTAELGTATISIREFLQLSVGDVIQLDQTTSDKIKIKVGEKVKFLGQPGTVRGRLAVQVETVLQERGESDE